MNSIILLLKTVFVVPCQLSVSFCKFYARNFDVDAQKEIIKRPAAANVK